MIIRELEHEAKATREMLSRVPADKLDWSPHAKSMPIGALATHLAVIPGNMARALEAGELNMSSPRPRPTLTSGAEFVAEFDRSLAAITAALADQTDEGMFEPFSMIRDGAILTTMPRATFLRTVLMNHSVHHRGQLSVYLRLLDLPVPATYGASADERQF
jgi:uncharacterized damage-inducible protein DinB